MQAARHFKDCRSEKSMAFSGLKARDGGGVNKGDSKSGNNNSSNNSNSDNSNSNNSNNNNSNNNNGVSNSQYSSVSSNEYHGRAAYNVRIKISIMDANMPNLFLPSGYKTVIVNDADAIVNYGSGWDFSVAKDPSRPPPGHTLHSTAHTGSRVFLPFEGS